MNNFKKILYHLKTKFWSANKLAKKKGVKFGKNCKFRTKRFGSEPYLIEIGDNFSTSMEVTFITHDGAVEVLRNMYPEYKKIDSFGKIKIGNNVFIGMYATILPHTIIGDNVIVGANSLVRGILKSNSVYAGVPVKRISSIEEYLNKNKKNFIYTKHLTADEKKEILLSNAFNE